MGIPSIEINNLSKRYSKSGPYALQNLSLTVNEGEVYGFLGPNGAGKSTTIRLLMNFIQPTGGQAHILGHDMVNDSVVVKRSVGYLSSDPGMYLKMTGRQFLDYMEDLQPAASSAYRQELIKRLQADPTKQLGKLSRGNKQKFGIIQAFMHQPAVLILDEPTSGLDPLMQEVFYELISEAQQRGASVFISSHVLSEVQKVCDRIGIIKSGRLVAERSIAEMTNQATQTFELTFAGKPPLTQLKKIDGLRLVSHKGNELIIQVHGKLAPLFAELAKHDVLKIDARQLDVEEMFMHFYADEQESLS